MKLITEKSLEMAEQQTRRKLDLLEKATKESCTKAPPHRTCLDHRPTKLEHDEHRVADVVQLVR